MRFSYKASFNIDQYHAHFHSTFTLDTLSMELKESLTSSNYKRLSRDNGGWGKTYVTEMPWREMAIDVDSLVFFHMRNYLNLPYRTPKDETMVCVSFLYDIEKSTRWMVDDMVRYSTRRFVSLGRYLTSIGVTYHLIHDIGIPPLKEDLYEERAKGKRQLENDIRALGTDILAPGMRSNLMSLVKKYALHFRDEVRDKVASNLPSTCVTHTDKECAKKYRTIMTEDVDVLLFGDKWTVIVKPFLDKPNHFDFVGRAYYLDKGIKSHEDFVQVALLIGTDYNRGIKGLGPKRAVDVINKYHTIERYVATKYDLTDEIAMAFVERCKKFLNYRA